MAELPSGTVTFLLTDVEGSTALWEEAPEAMRVALARHDALVRSAIVEHHGHVVKTTGDGFHAAFSRAPDALAAALDAQRRLQAEPWGEIGPLWVRMALHAGAAEERDGDYYGPPLNRVARLLGIGHGGQILLSQLTAELVRDELPAGVSLRDLGEHRLKGLERPERVFQVAHRELAADFPPLASLDACPHNLPVPPTPFLGREREVQAVRGLLLRDDIRLVTLTGPGGTGKTRLALQVAASLLDHWEDGGFFVALAPITDPSLVVSTVAQTIGIREAGGRPFLDSLKDYLRGKHVLLLLDNFEQVLPAAPLVADLLGSCLRLQFLVTSRASLHLRGEHEVMVPPLALPNLEHLPPVAEVAEYAAVALFVQQARAVNADFALTDHNAPAVAQVCARLDGLPLAIELAAPRVKLLSPQAMLGRLGSRLALLTCGAQDLPARQQTLRDTIVWSHDLLDERERTLFRRLAVFSGGCTLEAAETICNLDRDLGIDVLGGIASLVDQSLLRRDEVDGDTRFGMLETIREYAQERLDVSGESSRVRRQHAEYYLALAETAEEELVGPAQSRWITRLEHEHNNLRTALTSLHTAPAHALAQRLAGALYPFWYRKGYASEGRAWCARVLEMQPGDCSAARGKAHLAAGMLAQLQGENGVARNHFEAGLTTFQALRDPRGTAQALQNLGSSERYQGNFERAEMLLEKALALWADLHDRRASGMALSILAGLARRRGELDRAERLLEQSLGLLEQAGDSWGIAGRLGELGGLALERHNHERATVLFEQSLALRERLGDRGGIPWALENLGRIAYEQHDHERAMTLYRRSLIIFRELGQLWGIIECLEWLAHLALVCGRHEHSARLLGAASLLRETTNAPVPPAESDAYELAVSRIATFLGHETFATAWAEGRAMTLEQAVAYALDEPPSA